MAHILLIRVDDVSLAPVGGGGGDTRKGQLWALWQSSFTRVVIAVYGQRVTQWHFVVPLTQTTQHQISVLKLRDRKPSDKGVWFVLWMATDSNLRHVKTVAKNFFATSSAVRISNSLLL